MPVAVIILILIIITIITYKWLLNRNRIFDKKCIPHLNVFFLPGNTFLCYINRISGANFSQSLYNMLPKEKYFGFYDLTKPMLFIKDPELIAQLTITDFDYFEDRGGFVDEKTDTLFGNSLISLRGHKWRAMRNNIVHAFTGNKMRHMSKLMIDCAHSSTKYLSDQKVISWNVKDFFMSYTCDVIATCCFGLKLNSLREKSNLFYITAMRAAKFSSPRAIFRILLIKMMPRLTKFLGIEFTDSDIRKYFTTIILDTISEREREQIYRPDMIHALMDIKNTYSRYTIVDQSNKLTEDKRASTETTKQLLPIQWSNDALVAQCFVFFIAGLETVSTVLSFIAYELAMNPHIQSKLYTEVFGLHVQRNGQLPDYNSLKSMKYMNQVISETLRKWPPAPFLARLCVKDYNISNGKRIPISVEKGVSIWIPVGAIHNDPRYYPSPHTFDPERFSADNIKHIKPGTYMPFGIGPRNCVALRFAMLKLKAMIYFLLLNNSIHVNSQTEKPPQIETIFFNLTLKNGINVDLKPRAKQ